MDKKRVRIWASFNSNMFVGISCWFGPNQNKQTCFVSVLIFRVFYFLFSLRTFTDFLFCDTGISSL